MRHSAGDVPKSWRTEKLKSILEEHRQRKAQGDNSEPDGWCVSPGLLIQTACACAKPGLCTWA